MGQKLKFFIGTKNSDFKFLRNENQIFLQVPKPKFADFIGSKNIFKPI